MSDENVDQVIPTKKWEFDEEVTKVFDNMLERSIPQYQEMRDLIFALSTRYVKPKTDIVDLGASRGESIARMIDKYGAHNRFIAVEVSKPMLQCLYERFKGLITCGVVDVRDFDLRTGFPSVNASLITSILTIQFTPIEYRQRIIQDVYDSLCKGGAFIFVEKVIGYSSELDALFIKTYYDMKSSNGYTQEQIERKRMSLEGVLVPATAKWNEELLKIAGFTRVDCFWRFLNFAGWIAIK